jgi:hypothetical protein
MHFLIEELGDVDDLVVDIAKLAACPELGQDRGHRDPKVDALEVAHVADVLLAAPPDHREDAEIVAAIENG